MTGIPISVDPEPEDDWRPPSYGTPGRILVRVDQGDEIAPWYFQVLDYDSETSVYWLNEGMGIDFWLEGACEFPGPGTYVVEGVTGIYHRGDGWTTDDDEEWSHTSVRPATAEEIEGEAL